MITIPISAESINNTVNIFLKKKIKNIRLFPDRIIFDYKERKFSKTWIQIVLKIRKFEAGELELEFMSKSLLYQIGKLFASRKIRKKIRQKIKNFQLDEYVIIEENTCWIRLAKLINPWIAVFKWKLTGFRIEKNAIKLQVN